MVTLGLVLGLLPDRLLETSPEQQLKERIRAKNTLSYVF